MLLQTALIVLDKQLLRRGAAAPLPRRILLRAGPLTMLFEPEPPFLRYIRWGEREVLRGIYAAVRDRNWGTIPSRISDLRLDQGPDSFRAAFEVDCREGEIDFFWKGTIHGGADGTLRFDFDGLARSTFLRNRVGFCVLHPVAGCAGEPCAVEKVDGSVEQGRFPLDISAQQPFLDLRAISHRVRQDGPWLEVRFEGDVFEMEDQRNWTDASFKTYCTPTRIPYPVEVKAGERIKQSVIIRPQSLDGAPWPSSAPAAPLDPRQPVMISADPGEPAVPLPRLGLGCASHGQTLSHREIERLRALRLSHLRVDLRLWEESFRESFRRAAAEAEAIGTALEIAFHLKREPEREIFSLVEALQHERPRAGAFLALHAGEKSTPEHWLRLARGRLALHDLRSWLGAGTDADFAELQRGRPPVALVDFVAYSMNPQVHAFDDASLVETLAAQAATVESARKFCGRKPIAITPVTLRPRFLASATGSVPATPPGVLPFQVDPRQPSLFAAAWTLGSLKYLSRSRVESVTYYETTGWRGVMETEAGSPLPEKFASIPGAVFPLYHVLWDFQELAGGGVESSLTSDPLRAEGLILRRGEHTRILVASFATEPMVARIVHPALRGKGRLKRLDDQTAERAMTAPEDFRADPGELVAARGGAIEVEMLPYSVARLDF